LRSLLLALLVAALTGCAQAIDLTTARAVESAAARPQDVDFRAASTVALPDNWRRTRSAATATATVWYAVPLDAALAQVRSRDRLALVVPRVAEEATFWLNGERLTPAAGLGATRNRAIWLDLPAGLRPTGNALEVRVEGVPLVRNGLSAIRLGSAAELRFAYEARRFVQTTLPLLLLVLVPIAFFAALALWLKTRRRTHLLFMALCVLWLPRAAVMVSPLAGLPPAGPVALLIVLTSLAATALVALLGLEYLEGAPAFRRDYRRVVGVCAVLSGWAAIGWALVEPLSPRAFSVLHWPTYAHLVVLAGAHAWAAWRNPRPAIVCTALALAGWAVAAAHDFAQLHDATAFDSFFWSPTAVLLVFLVFGWRSLEALRNTSPPAARRG
jgi:hypothetical protein